MRNLYLTWTRLHGRAYTGTWPSGLGQVSTDQSCGPQRTTAFSIRFEKRSHIVAIYHAYDNFLLYIERWGHTRNDGWADKITFGGLAGWSYSEQAEAKAA